MSRVSVLGWGSKVSCQRKSSPSKKDQTNGLKVLTAMPPCWTPTFKVRLQVSVLSNFDQHSPRQWQKKNQSVENAGVAFVKGTNERNELFEKINKR